MLESPALMVSCFYSVERLIGSLSVLEGIKGDTDQLEGWLSWIALALIFAGKARGPFYRDSWLGLSDSDSSNDAGTPTTFIKILCSNPQLQLSKNDEGKEAISSIRFAQSASRVK